MNHGRERRQRRWWRRLRTLTAFAAAFVLDTVEGGWKYVDLAAMVSGCRDKRGDDDGDSAGN